MNRSIFITRFKDLYKEKGFTQEKLADKLNVSTNTIKSYTKKDGVFPPITMLYAISDLFEVDIDYLLGRQECRKKSSQTICDLTGLSEKSANKLIEITNLRSSAEIDTLNDLLEDSQIDNLLLTIFHYLSSHNESITSHDSVLENNIDYNIIQSKEMIKFCATDCFNNMIEKMYNSRKDFYRKLRFDALVNNLIIDTWEKVNTSELFIDDWEHDSNRKEMYQLLLEIVKSKFTELHEYYNDDFFLFHYTPETFIKNINTIYKFCGYDSD